MSRPENTDPFQPWNDPARADDPWEPWNDPCKQDDPFACWNNHFGTGKYEDEI